MYGIEVPLKGIASLQNFIKFYHLVQLLERDGTQMDRRNDYPISLTFLSKGSALNIDSVPCSMVTLTEFSGAVVTCIYRTLIYFWIKLWQFFRIKYFW
jgi:hypothetical protein